jgi:membrane carboxypeptidase/penicillin-binding protein
MTSVHGQPQQGGYLPAEIWHAYMSAVTEGQPCSEFPPPTEPLSYQPFYGKYASTGQAQSNQEGEAEAKAPKKKAPKPGKGPAGERPAGPPPPPAEPPAALRKTGGASPK